MRWKINSLTKAKLNLKNLILIEGLPGIGNVGKIVADFIIEELDAKKVYDVFSYSMPHSVFVNEENLVELPKIEVYHAKTKKNDFLIISGDVQPIDEESCYEFSEAMIDLAKEHGVKEIITLGGIGLHDTPKKPKVYCTANNHEIIEKYVEGTKVSNDVYGVIGPIMGVSGLLLGLGEKKDVSAISFLAETLGHPMYLGVKGAKEMLKVLNKKLALDLDLKKIDKEIKSLDAEMKKTEELNQATSGASGKKDKKVNYIG
ncbi:hypothetical protein GOV05_03260 [Candidatus Woesearchaeota archaeon]|nr:hypothetical protein [Candidatus Woesearchaeota archaeon]